MYSSCLYFKAFWVSLEMHKSIYSFFDVGFNTSIKLAQGILKQILNGLSFLGSRIGILKLHLLALQTCKP